MDEKFEEYLRATLPNKVRNDKLNRLSESFDRISEYKGKNKEELERRNAVIEKKKEEAMEQIRKKTEEKLNEIKKMESLEKANFEKMTAEIKAKADKEMAEKMKKYDEIISDNRNLLKAEKLILEKELLETDSHLREINQKIQDTVTAEREKIDEKREEMKEKAKKKSEEQLKEVIEMQDNQLKIEIETRKQVEAKKNESHENRTRDVSELADSNFKMKKTQFKTLLISNSNYNNGEMTAHITRLQEILDEIKTSYSRCSRHFIKEDDWNEKGIKKARDEFDSLSSLFNKLRRELTNAERKLAEMKADETSGEMTETIKKMRSVLSSLNYCVSKFIGLLMSKTSGKIIWNQEAIQELSELMLKFAEIQLPIFNSNREEMKNHLGEYSS